MSEETAETEDRPDTPRTNAAYEFMHDRGLTAWVPVEVSRTLEREVNMLLGIVKAFCKDQEWAVDAWKNQPHIKPLFDIARTGELRYDPTIFHIQLALHGQPVRTRCGRKVTRIGLLNGGQCHQPVTAQIEGGQEERFGLDGTWITGQESPWDLFMVTPNDPKLLDVYRLRIVGKSTHRYSSEESYLRHSPKMRKRYSSTYQIVTERLWTDGTWAILETSYPPVKRGKTKKKR